MRETSDSRDVRLCQLAEEFAARQRAGETPSLQDYCDRHPDLADDIRSLFPAMAELEQAKADAAAPAVVQDAEPQATRLGDFILLREVGRGGMGVVYEAEQVSLGRRVALKLLPSNVFRDPIKRRRFEREAKSAAKLHHTNIVPVHGFGEHDGTPYYVMQFIPGLGLDAVIEELADGTNKPRHTPTPAAQLSVALARSLMGATASAVVRDDAPTMTAAGASTPGTAPHVFSNFGNSSVSMNASGVHLPGQSGSGTGSTTNRRTTYWESVARIGVQVAGALAYAHKLGVLHRDIKPGNLLLDLDGIVWVTDFGLAKGSDSDNLTQTGDLLGTFRYMPPEAFEGKSDSRSDIYALGLTLFELVALRPAYEERDRNKLIKQVTTGDPLRLRKLRKDAPRDLVTIVEKAIEKDPTRRYQSAGAMADDLQRYLDGRPITARRATELERMWMWARRRPAMAGLVAAFILCLIAGTVISTVFAVRADQFAHDAADREQDANAARDEAKRQEAGAVAARDQAKNREAEAVAARDQAKQTRNDAALQAAGLVLDRGIEDARAGETARALHLFVRALRTLPADDPRSEPLERAIRANLAAWAETATVLEHIWTERPRFSGLAFSRDGERVVMQTSEDEIRCFKTLSGEPVGPPIAASLDLGAAIAFAPDGSSFWVSSPGREKPLAKKWDLLRFDSVTGQRLEPRIPLAGPVDQLHISADGRTLLGAVNGIHPEEQGPQANASRQRAWRTASLVVWNAATGEPLRTEPVNALPPLDRTKESPDTYMAFSADGKVFAWVQRGESKFEHIIFPSTGKEPAVRTDLASLAGKSPGIYNFQHDFRTGLAIQDNLIHRWSAAKPGVLGPGIPTPFRIMKDGLSADGRAVTSQHDGRAFDIGTWPPRPTGVRFAHPGWHRGQNGFKQESPDGRFVATWDFGQGDGRLWRLPRPHSRPPLPGSMLASQPIANEHFQSGAIDPAGKHAVLWGIENWGLKNSRIQITDLETGTVRNATVRHQHLVREIVFSPDAKYFATASFDSTARVFETATGRPAGPPMRHMNYVASVAFSPDGNTLAAGDYGPKGQIRFWNWRDAEPVREPLEHDDIILNVRFSPDGKWIVATKTRDWSKSPEIVMWDVGTGEARARIPHSGPSYNLIEPVRIRADSKVAIARDSTGLLKMWEVPGGKFRGQHPLDGDGISRFSTDGTVVAASANLGVRLLDGNTLDPLPNGYLPHPDPIRDLAFSPDGKLLLTAHITGSAQLWDVPTRKPLGSPAVLVGPIRAVGFTPDGTTCIAVAADGSVRKWKVPAPFVEPNLARLADRVALMTGQRLGENQGLELISTTEWQALRQNLVGLGSTGIVPPRADAEWHDGVATDAEQDGDAFGAEWHLSRLRTHRPKDWTIPARLGHVLAAAGRREDAAKAYEQAKSLAPSVQELSDWHRTIAASDEIAGRNESGLWNVDRAIILTPKDWTLYLLRSNLADPVRAVADLNEAIRLGGSPDVFGRALGRAIEASDWKRAAPLLNHLGKLPNFNLAGRHVQALANLKVGDAAAYREACVTVAKAMPAVGPRLDAGTANNAAMLFAQGPAATEDWTKPLAWIDHALKTLDEFEKANPNRKDMTRRDRRMFLNTRGAVLFRAGKHEDALKSLEAGRLLAGGGEFHDWVFIAIAEHKLGHADAAKSAGAKARAAPIPKDPVERAEVELLLAELDAALPSR